MNLLNSIIWGKFNASLIFLYSEVHVQKMDTIVYIGEIENMIVHTTWFVRYCSYIIDISFIIACM